jgi:hypothetical protein
MVTRAAHTHAGGQLRLRLSGRTPASGKYDLSRAEKFRGTRSKSDPPTCTTRLDYRSVCEKLATLGKYKISGTASRQSRHHIANVA